MKMSLLNYRCLPTLKGKYECIIDRYMEVENENGGHIAIYLELPDREFKWCVFPSQIDYVCKNLNFTLGEERSTYPINEALEIIKNNKTKLELYFNYNTEYKRMNVSFQDNSEEPEAVTEDLI